MNVKEISESDLVGQRWYAGKGRGLVAVRAVEALPVPGEDARLVIAEVSYADGGSERYTLIEGVVDWPALLRACPVEGEYGSLELRPGPAFAALLLTGVVLAQTRGANDYRRLLTDWAGLTRYGSEDAEVRPPKAGENRVAGEG